ncbi:MAG: nucleotidyltransferase domain-containing protein [Anaerolineales bacterium]
MLDEQVLQKIVRRVVEAVNPSRVILFGSQARCEADEQSDIDLMVLKPEVKNIGQEMIHLYQAIGTLDTGIDVLLYSDAEFEVRSQVPGTVLYWARKEGRNLYVAAS